MLFCFAVPFSLAEKKMRFRATDSANREKIAPLRANHTARLARDFKMGLINVEMTSTQKKKIRVPDVV